LQSELKIYNELLGIVNNVIQESNKKNIKNIWLSIDLLTLFLKYNLRKVPPEIFLKLINEIIDRKTFPIQSIFISTFNFDFPKKKLFDLKETPSQSGSFGNQILKISPERRTSHPLYSFICFGKLASEFNEKNFKSSFGHNSLFEWMIENDFKILSIGHHYVKAFSFCHNAEAIVGVNYRFKKSFQGRIKKLDGKEYLIECDTYVRNIDLCNFSGLTIQGDNFLREKLACEKFKYDNHNSIISYLVDMKFCNELLINDLKTEHPILIGYSSDLKINNNLIYPAIADNMYKNS
jgi:hypothetical protein